LRPAAGTGLTPWLVWGLGALFYSYGMFQRVAPVSMVAELMRDFAATAAVLGNLSAFFFYAYAGMQIPVGMLVDQWGPRRMLSVAAALCASGGVVFATADTLGAAYAGRFLLGAGAAAGWLSTLQLANVWLPRDRFAMVAGLTVALGILGGVAAQAPLAAVVGSIGWRPPMLWASAVCVGLGVTIWMVVRDGGNIAGGSGGAIAHDLPADAGGAGRRALPGKLWSAVRVGNTWLIVVAVATVVGPMLAFAGLWGVPYMMETYGLPRTAAAAAPSAVLIGVGAGGLLFGWVSDRMGRRKPAIVIAIWVAIATWTVLLSWTGMPLVLAYLVLFVGGMANGAVVLSFALIRDQNDPAVVGTVSGVVNAGAMGSGAIYQPFVGWLLDLQWTGAMAGGVRTYSTEQFQLAFSIFPIILLIGAAAIMFVRERPPSIK
jgi:MFS family permease